MDAHLGDAPGFPGHLDHAAPLVDGEGKRLFDVDVKACLAGVDEHDGVPVVRRADHYGVITTASMPFNSRSLR